MCIICFLVHMCIICFLVHMCTYRQELIDRYARLSAILEIDISLAQQAQREVSFIYMNV